MDSLSPRLPTVDWRQAVGERVRAWWLAKMLGTTLGMTAFFLIYFWLLRHPAYPVTIMPLTAVDRMIGFFPGALPLYLSLWFYVSLAPALLVDRRELVSYGLATVALSAIGLGVFLFWPTAVPRPEVDWSRHAAFGFLKNVDAAGNACPSLHVAFAVFTAVWFERILRQMRARGFVRALNWVWCVGIVYATMAVRQHVALDALAGVVLGALVAAAHLRILRAFNNRTPEGTYVPAGRRFMMNMPAADASRDVTAINRDFYDALWRRARVHQAEDFNTWPLVASLLPTAPERLEIGPGLHPRVPIAGTHFVDLSQPAVERLAALGGAAVLGEITALPYAAGRFDLVVAFDVIEHVSDDRQACSELCRVLKPGGRLLMSVPLHAAHWTEFDALVGHARRYDLAELRALLAEHGLTVEKSAAFGMRPTNPRLLRHGMRWLSEHRETAMRWYNWVLMPLGLKFQKRLNFAAGWIDASEADGMVLVCRRGPA